MTNRNNLSNGSSNQARTRDSQYPNPEYNAEPNIIATDATVNARSATQEEIAYREGYVQGRERERVHDTIQQDIQHRRESNSAATGLIMGVILAGIVGLIIAALTLLGQDRQPTVTPSPTNPPQPQTNSSPSPQSAENQSAEKTTIIERVPQVVPAPQQTDVTIPSPTQVQPAPPQTTQPQIVQPQPQMSPSQSLNVPNNNSATPSSTPGNSSQQYPQTGVPIDRLDGSPLGTNQPTP